MLKFRNIEGDTSFPVVQWGVEGILAVLERGDSPDWKKLYLAIATPSAEQQEIRDNLSEAITLTSGGYLGEHIARLFEEFLEETADHKA